jgi:anti-anti-sigma factor
VTTSALQGAGTGSGGAAPPFTKTFRCHVTYCDDWARVTAQGGLHLSTVPMLRRMVLAAAVLPISGVTLDLAGVDSVDRYAVNALVTLRRQVRDQSAAFSLASVSHPVRRALEAAGVGELFDHESVWSGYPSPDGGSFDDVPAQRRAWR